ncbi:hypothetical protein Bpfe_009430, partial [Biomphalaria pfeifferi]
CLSLSQGGLDQSHALRPDISLSNNAIASYTSVYHLPTRPSDLLSPELNVDFLYSISLLSLPPPLHPPEFSSLTIVLT